jgi:four helix bundle protein
MQMAEIRSFRDLDAWRASIRLAVVVYGVAKQLPATERFELAAQMRRAAVSVPSNVAEGQATGPGGRYRHHVRIALGSWAELVTHVELVKALRLLAPELLSEFEAQLDKTGQLLHGLSRSLRYKALAKGAFTLLLLGCCSTLLT